MTQPPLFPPDSDWLAPDTLPDLSTAKRIAVDCETYDPELLQKGPGWASGPGHVVGISVATDDGFRGYYPIAHEGGGNLDRGQVLPWLRQELARPDQPKVFANASYDVGWLLRENVIVAGALYDVQVAEPLLNEHRQTYRLDALAADYLGRRKDEKLLRSAAQSWGVDAKSGLHKLPACFVGPYAEEDAALTLAIFEQQEERLKADDLWSLFTMESELLPMLIAMRLRGVRVDVQGTHRLSALWKDEEALILREIAQRWRPVDPWNGAAIAAAFDKAQVPYPRTETGLPSFQSKWLAGHSHPLPQLVAGARRLNKARSTFLDGHILDHLRGDRVHCEFHPLRSEAGGTITGRMSSSNPNLQQIPARDPLIGPAVRGLFLPEPDCEWLSMDYAQQEPRLMVHYADLLGIPGAGEAARRYKTDPDADYHQMIAEMAGIPRAQAKTINLGLAYGMGQKKLGAELGLAAQEASELIEQYHQAVPFLRGLSDRCVRRASDVGALRTVLGRRARFPHWEPADFSLAQARWKVAALRKPMLRHEAEATWPGQPLKRSFLHTALNRLIQGSAADMTKKAMVDLWRAGLLPHVQVHDELCFSVRHPRESEAIAEIMQNALDLRVPVRVSGKRGPSWGLAK